MASNLSRLNQIKTKLKQAFLSWQYQSLNSAEIDKYFSSITSSKPSNLLANQTIGNQLKAQAFWQELEKASGFSKEVDDLKTQWNSVGIFADFTAQELMQIKRDNFDICETSILRALEELQSDLKRYELNGLWRPKWMLTWHQEKIAELKNKYQIFLILKKQLQSSLLLQTHLASHLGTSKYVDDIYFYFVEKINGLAVVKNKLSKPANISSALDDDTRAAIFDFLSTDSAIKRTDLEVIIEPISQSPYEVPVKPAQVQKETKTLTEFSDRVETRLQLTSTAKFKQEKQEKEKTESWLNQKLVLPFSKYISSTMLSNSLVRMWRYRWILALMLTCSLYFWFASAVVTYTSLSVGAWAAQLSANLLFYGFALFPAYVMGVKTIKTIGQVLYGKLSYWKMREIHQSLEVLKLNQRFISSQLSSGIIDVAFFNIAGLEISAQTTLKKIDEAIEMLQKIKLTTRVVYWGQLKSSNLKVLAELKSQKSLIESRLKIYATHISQRLSESLASLQSEISSSALKPIIPKSQITQLSNFVKKYGSPEDQKRFSQSARLTSLFSAALLNNTLKHRAELKTQLNQPWGGFKSNVPGFNGWRTLIEHYVLDEHQKNAALNIIDILTGHKSCTIAELGAWISVIAEEDNKRQLMSNIQQHIFLTLDERPSRHAKLLSAEQKDLIVNWGKSSKGEIEAARNFIAKLNSCKNIQNILVRASDSTLIEHFEALEGLERLEAARGAGRIEQNAIREMLEKYDGSTSRLVYFLKFLPHHLKGKQTSRMALERLNWLMNNQKATSEDIFDDADTELFKHCALSDEFSFEKTVKDSKQYNQPWSKIFSVFLKQCTQNGFDDGSLSLHYETMNERVKDFFQKSHKAMKAVKGHPQREDSNTQQKINTKAVRGVRCA